MTTERLMRRILFSRQKSLQAWETQEKSFNLRSRAHKFQVSIQAERQGDKMPSWIRSLPNQKSWKGQERFNTSWRRWMFVTWVSPTRKTTKHNHDLRLRLFFFEPVAETQLPCSICDFATCKSFRFVIFLHQIWLAQGLQVRINYVRADLHGYFYQFL